jgi:PRC-barrel domain
MLSPADAEALAGATVFDPADEEVGTVAELYLDAGDDQPAWAAVEREGRRMLVPLDGAARDGDTLRVRYDLAVIDEAPEARGDALDARAQHALLAHYGLTDADLRDDSGWATDRPAGATRRAGAADPRAGGQDDAQAGHP